jgi:hypothetical protein
MPALRYRTGVGATSAWGLARHAPVGGTRVAADELLPARDQ